MAEEGKGGEVKKKSNMLLFIVIGVVILALLGGGAFFFMQSKSSKKENNQEKEEKKFGEIFKLNEFVVNLSEVTRYLKAQIVLEVDNKKVLDELEKKRPEIRDSIILLLSSKSATELSDLSGKRKLKNEIMLRINNLLETGKVIDVFFVQFVIQ